MNLVAMISRTLWVPLALVFTATAGETGEWTEWVSGNGRGVVREVKRDLPAPVNALQVREQAGFGLIDLRLGFDVKGGTVWSEWTASNPRGHVRSVSVPPSVKVVGIAVREQSGYGLIDAKLLFTIRDVAASTPWIADNPRGPVKQVICQRGSYVGGFRVREQAGFGIVDLQLYCQRN